LTVKGSGFGVCICCPRESKVTHVSFRVNCLGHRDPGSGFGGLGERLRVQDSGVWVEGVRIFVFLVHGLGNNVRGLRGDAVQSLWLPPREFIIKFISCQQD